MSFQDPWLAIQALLSDDNKLLNDLGVRYIPSVLEEGEVPKVIAEGTKTILVATDRRLIVIKKTFIGDAVSLEASYAYDDMRTFRADMGFMSIGCNMLLKDGKVKTIAIKKGKRMAFAQVVRSHLPNYQTEDTQTVSSPQATGKMWPWIVASSVGAILLLVAVGICFPSEEEPSTGAVATATPTSGPTATLVPAPTNYFGVTRSQANKRFQDLNIGLMPLNRHTDDWYSISLPDGSIMIDIFGPSSGVQAIESTFRLTPTVAAQMDSVVVPMLQIALGDDWRDGERWLVREMEQLSEVHTKSQVKMGIAYLTLYFIPRLESVMISVDTERQ